MSRLQSLFSVSALILFMAGTSLAQSQGAFIFGSRSLEVPNPNAPGNYTMVLHENSPAGYDAIEYDAVRGWGFEAYDSGNADRNTSARFGPFDDSPNNRNRYDDIVPDELYDSFIGFKSHASTCSEAEIGDTTSPCAPTIPASGGIFRVDVSNGLYRFNAIVSCTGHLGLGRLGSDRTSATPLNEFAAVAINTKCKSRISMHFTTLASGICQLRPK